MLVSAYYDKEPNVIQNNENNINVKFITGEIKNRKFCVGYCNNNIHPGYLTKKLVDKHKCHEKECAFFFENIINKDTNEKKIKTDNINLSLEKQQSDKKRCTEISEFVCKNFEGVKIINFDKDYNQVWLLRYASIFNIDEELLKSNIEQLLQAKFMLKRIKCDFDTAVKLVCGE